VVTSSGRQDAGVHYPPPLLYVAGLAAGYALHWWRPFEVVQSPSAMRAVESAAIGLIAAWALIFAAALFQFARSHTTLIPNRPASALATSGIYRFTRNPMYLSLLCLYAGLALLLNSAWPLLLLPLVVVAVNRLVIAREERYLAAAFPGEYEAYRRRVRRWL
jgi:protein-S-isoprenylcysteine O-methyltransferase Ste14